MSMTYGKGFADTDTDDSDWDSTAVLSFFSPVFS